MPIKSPAQNRLMEAAAHTEGGYGGVSQAVGKKFVAAGKSYDAAGDDHDLRKAYERYSDKPTERSHKALHKAEVTAELDAAAPSGNMRYIVQCQTAVGGWKDFGRYSDPRLAHAHAVKLGAKGEKFEGKVRVIGKGSGRSDAAISAKKPRVEGKSPAAQAIRAKIKGIKDAGGPIYTVYVHVSGSDYTPEPKTFSDMKSAHARVEELKARGKSARVKASRPGRKDAGGYDLDTLIKRIKEAQPKKDGAMPLNDDCMDMVKGIAAKADAIHSRLDGVERTLARGRVLARLDEAPVKEDAHGIHREARKGKALQKHAERGDADEHEVEIQAERKMDRLDREYQGGSITKTEYNKRVKLIDDWVKQQLAKKDSHGHHREGRKGKAARKNVEA